MKSFFFMGMLLLCWNLPIGWAQPPSPVPSPVSQSPVQPSLKTSIIPFLNIGLPVMTTLGLHYPLAPDWSLFFAAGYFPFHLIPRFAYHSGQIEVWGRWHVSNIFFIGTMLGYQSLQGNLMTTLGSLDLKDSDPTPANTSVTLNSFYAGIGLGFLVQLSESLFMGVDAGFQFPFLAWGAAQLEKTSELSLNFHQSSKQSVTYLAYHPLPRIQLLRIGWKF